MKKLLLLCGVAAACVSPSPASRADAAPSPLLLAASKGESVEAAVLIQRGADLEARDERTGGSALHLAAGACKPDIVRLLVEAKADLNARRRDSWTPLMLAAASNCAAAAKFLIAGGADPSLKDGAGRDAARLASERGFGETTQAISGAR